MKKISIAATICFVSAIVLFIITNVYGYINNLGTIFGSSEIYITDNSKVQSIIILQILGAISFLFLILGLIILFIKLKFNLYKSHKKLILIISALIIGVYLFLSIYTIANSFLIPQGENVSTPETDIQRQADVNQIAAAISSYKKDTGSLGNLNNIPLCSQMTLDDVNSGYIQIGTDQGNLDLSAVIGTKYLLTNPITPVAGTPGSTCYLMCKVNDSSIMIWSLYTKVDGTGISVVTE